MSFRRVFFSLAIALAVPALLAQPPAQSSSSSSPSSKQVRKLASHADSPLDSGTVNGGVYRSAAFGFTCKIPAAWVLRTEEMNAREADDASPAKASRAAPDRTAGGDCPHMAGCGRVLLAAFSRPPEARAEDVNASILIAAENAAVYPGLKDAAQYFGPVSEVAKAQGFEVVEEPYEFSVGAKTVVRGDFQKNMGTRVMRQSTLVMLAQGYALSFTFIGGTEDEVEELVQGLSFGAKSAR
jgi:hypothetical protein